VIAIGNVRLFESAGQTRDLTERWSSRQRLRMCCKSSAVLPVICNRSQVDVEQRLANLRSKSFGSCCCMTAEDFCQLNCTTLLLTTQGSSKTGLLFLGQTQVWDDLLQARGHTHSDVMAGTAYAERDPLRICDGRDIESPNLLAVPMLKDTDLSEPSSFIARKFDRLAIRQIETVTNFAARPSSPSKTHGYSRNCVNERTT